MPAEPFFMVYSDGQGAPTVVHRDFSAARREAERLARNHPGITFYVMGTVARALKADVDFKMIDAMEIPF